MFFERSAVSDMLRHLLDEEEIRSTFHLRSCFVDRHDCILNRRREQRLLPRDQLPPVDREAGHLSRASAKLCSSACLATAVDKRNSSILRIT